MFMILALFTPNAYSRYTSKNLSKLADYNLSLLSSSSIDEGTNWAVLVAGSRGYGNYRHQVSIILSRHFYLSHIIMCLANG